MSVQKATIEIKIELCLIMHAMCFELRNHAIFVIIKPKLLNFYYTDFKYYKIYTISRNLAKVNNWKMYTLKCTFFLKMKMQFLT